MMQVVALSATFSEDTMESLLPMMKKPQRINLCEETVSLLGIRQLYSLVPPPVTQHSQGPCSTALMEHKGRELLQLLRRLSFNQVRKTGLLMTPYPGIVRILVRFSG